MSPAEEEAVEEERQVLQETRNERSQEINND
jgi:hypothetical protein